MANQKVSDSTASTSLDPGDLIPIVPAAGGSNQHMTAANLIRTYTRTTAEIAASVTPTDYSYEPGDVRRYGATGDGVADDATTIGSAVTSTHTVLFDGNVNYRVNTTTDGLLINTDNVHLVGDYDSAVFSDTSDYRAITVGNLTDDRPTDFSIVGLEVYNNTTGTDNNRQTVKLGGVERVLVAFNYVSDGYYGFGPHYSDQAATAGQERRTSQMRLVGNLSTVTGTAYEYFSVTNSVAIGNVAYKSGTRATDHGLRIIGYGTDEVTNSQGSDIRNIGNAYVGNVVDNYQNGIRVQKGAFENVIVGNAVKSGNVAFHTTNNGESVGSQSRNNVLCGFAANEYVGGFVLEKTERHIFDSFSISEFDDRGIDHKVSSSTSTYGTGKYCRFSGLLSDQQNSTDPAAIFEGNNNRISLTLADIIAADGVRINGDHNIVDIIGGEMPHASSALVRVNGDNNIVSVAGDGLTNAVGVRITGDNNDITCNLDGAGGSAVLISGTGNTLRGNCALSAISAGNDVTGVLDAKRRDSASGTTDVSGDLTITHGLVGGNTSYIAMATATGTTFANVQIHTKTSTTFKIRFFDAAGAAITSTAVTCDWRAEQDYG